MSVRTMEDLEMNNASQEMSAVEKGRCVVCCVLENELEKSEKWGQETA